MRVHEVNESEREDVNALSDKIIVDNLLQSESEDGILPVSELDANESVCKLIKFKHHVVGIVPVRSGLNERVKSVR